MPASHKPVVARGGEAQSETNHLEKLLACEYHYRSKLSYKASDNKDTVVDERAQCLLLFFISRGLDPRECLAKHYVADECTGRRIMLFWLAECYQRF